MRERNGGRAGLHTSASSLSSNDAQRVMKAVDQYLKNPESPSLNLEPVSGKVGAQRLWTIRASQEIRILLARQGSLTVFLRAGRHDDIYLLARRSAFVAPRDGAPALVGITSADDGFERLLQDDETPLRGAESVERAIRDREETGERAGERAGERTEPSLLEHWADKEIAELGFATEEVALLRQSKADNLLDVKDAGVSETQRQGVKPQLISAGGYLISGVVCDRQD